MSTPISTVRRLLDLLAVADARATFFVLGWVAQRLPELVRDIARAEHEVASHGWSHTAIWRLSQAAFFDEVSRSRALLEELGGQPVHRRAQGKSGAFIYAGGGTPNMLKIVGAIERSGTFSQQTRCRRSGVRIQRNPSGWCIPLFIASAW